MFSKCEGCKLGPGGRTPFGIFWYSANRPAFFFRGIKPSCNFFFAKNVLVRNCCLCVGVQKKWSRFVFVWLFFLFWLIFYLGTGLDFSLWAIQHLGRCLGVLVTDCQPESSLHVLKAAAWGTSLPHVRVVTASDTLGCIHRNAFPL